MGPQYPYHPLINPSGHKETNNLSNIMKEKKDYQIGGGFNMRKLKKSTVNFFGNNGYPQMPIENINALDDSMYDNIYGDNQQQFKQDRKNNNLPMYMKMTSGPNAGQTGYFQNGQMISEGFNNNLNNNNMQYPNFRSRMENNPSYLPNFMQMGGEQSPQDQMQDQQMQQAPQEGGGDPQQMAQQIVQEFQQLPPELQQAVMQALMQQGGGQQAQDPAQQPQQKMGGYNNPGFRNLPQSVQEKIMRNS